MNKQYILFDHDGVLVDTEKLYFKATEECISDFGVKLTQDHYLKLQAQGKSAWYMAREKGFSDKEIQSKRQERNRLYQKYISQESVEIPGVVDTLETLSEKYNMAIVTTSRPEDFNHIHKTDRILKYMDFCLKLGDYERTKPYPDPYLSALDRFGISADKAVVIEDSQRGLESAFNAGIDCVIIQNEFTKGQDFSKAKLIIDSFPDLLKILL